MEKIDTDYKLQNWKFQAKLLRVAKVTLLFLSVLK